MRCVRANPTRRCRGCGYGADIWCRCGCVDPRADGGCGHFCGSIRYAGGALGATGTLVAAGVVGGAVGSIASQGVGIATGIQEKFSWKSVGLAAIGGGVGAGLGGSAAVGKLLGKTGVFQSAIRGAVGSALTQGIGVATGLQDKFSWVGVAGAAVGADIAAGVGGTFGDSFGGKLATSGASAIANAATRSAISGTNFGDNIRAAIPDVIGQALGNAIASNFSSSGGSFSFNFQAAISDTIGLIAGLPQGIINGLGDIYTNARTTNAESVAELPSVASPEIITPLAPDPHSVGDPIVDEIISRGVRVYQPGRADRIMANFWREVEVVTANENARWQSENAALAAQNTSIYRQTFTPVDMSNLSTLDIHARGGLTTGDSLRILGGLGLVASAELGKASVNEFVDLVELGINGAAFLLNAQGMNAELKWGTVELPRFDVLPSATWSVRAGGLFLAGAGIARGGVGLVDEGLELGARVADDFIGAPSFATNSGEAYFWSGLGRNGFNKASTFANTGNGVTLESFISSRGINMPVWDPSNPASLKAWQDVSRVYAQGARGDVRVIIGDNLRPNSVWQTIELPALQSNPNITRIIKIDSKSGNETIIWP